MRTPAPALLLTAECASVPRPFPPFPKSGVQVIRMDQATLFQTCGGLHALDDKGNEIGHYRDFAGCYDEVNKKVYIEDSCRGAQAFVHERAHEEGVEDPEKAGYNW